MCALVLTTSLLLAACQSVSLPGFGDSTKAATAPPVIPAAAQAQFDAAVAAQNAQQWPEAERQMQQLLEKYPYYSGPALNLALIAAQTQRPEQAEDYFKRALQINPASGVAGNQYGIWLRTQGRFADAETIYLQTLARAKDSDKESADIHLNLAILYDLYLGRPAPALEHYQRYLELNPELQQDEKNPVHGWVADLQRRTTGAAK